MLSFVNYHCRVKVLLSKNIGGSASMALQSFLIIFVLPKGQTLQHLVIMLNNRSLKRIFKNDYSSEIGKDR